MSHPENQNMPTGQTPPPSIDFPPQHQSEGQPSQSSQQPSAGYGQSQQIYGQPLPQFLGQQGYGAQQPIQPPYPLYSPSVPSDQQNIALHSQHLGNLVKSYQGSYIRFAWPVLLGALSIFGFIASIFQESFAGILLWGVIGICCAIWYQSLRNFSADLYEQGFVITKGNKVTRARWNEIANVEHWIHTMRYYFVIPVSRTHSFVITLYNGQKVKVTNAFQNEMQLGTAIQRMWAQAAKGKTP